MASRAPDEKPKFTGISLIGVSLGTFGFGLFIASRQNKKARSKSDPRVEKPVTPRQFSPHFHAIKALGIATGIVGATALCIVGAATWYLDVQNMDEFNQHMKRVFRKWRPRDFKDVDPTQTIDWDTLNVKPQSTQNNANDTTKDTP